MDLDKGTKLINTFNPQVSIIVPVYNGSDYLQEAIESALVQTYRNVEIIVVNDGSDDEGKTENIALSYGDRIRYYCKENGGVASALNLGIKNMKGEYFSWLSHDDLYYPDKILKQIEFITDLEEKNVFLFSDFEFVDKDSNHFGYVKRERSLTKFPYLSIIFNQIHGCSVLIHKNLLEEVKGFPEDKKTTQDYHTWLSILKLKYKFYHIPLVLIKSRIHENQGSTTMSEVCKKEIQEFYERLIDEVACNCSQNYYKILNYFFYKDLELFKKLNSSILNIHKSEIFLMFRVKGLIIFFNLKLIARKIRSQISDFQHQKL
jgi:glycosyltransferase involved in cell wall biosynthesis